MTTLPLRTIALDERGVASIAGTGIKVKEVVIDKIVWNLTPEEMLASHPHWSLPVTYAALSCYYDHQAEGDAQIERDRAWIREQQAQNPSKTIFQSERPTILFLSVLHNLDVYFSRKIKI